MKKFIVALMAIAMVGFFSCQKEEPTPDGNGTNTEAPGGNPTPSDTTVTPSPAETFYGEWGLVFEENATLHYNLATDAAIQSFVPSMENDMVLDGNQWSMLIEQATGSQVDITGTVSIDLGFQGVPAIPLSFQTTGTVSDNGLTIDPAEINSSIMAMNVIPVDLTGTITFVQPTALPVDGVLTVVMDSLDIDGVGQASFGQISGGLTLDVTGSKLKSAGARVNLDQPDK